uniref:NADH-ubiquinone oxidoreductase chain 4L n=1 Tax=Phascolosoma scolops TaxID=210802 RepID=A0A8E8FT95_9ANNE|nr:NADH dehydrogenase subunit 4L [Phascolosoma scolops]
MFFSTAFILSSFPMWALITLLLQRKQFLMALLALEVLALSLVMILLFSSMKSLFLLLLILPMAACEASVGLALLVSSTRHFGSDMLSNLTTSKW